ncbi:translocation/assembly module TamB domain-containing protein [Coprobacter sp.]
MKQIFRGFKYIIVSILAILIIVYAGLYLLLSIPSVQQEIRDISERELSRLMKTRLTIDRVHIYPFNKATLEGVCLYDQKNDTLLYAEKLMAGFSPFALLDRQLIFTTAQLFDFKVDLYKNDPGSETNFQFLIDALTPKKKKEKRPLDIQLNTILVRRGTISYNVLSEPYKEPGIFDKNHIRLDKIVSTVSLKALRKDSLNINVRRISFEEQSGFQLSKLTFKLQGNDDKATLSNFRLNLENSYLGIRKTDINLSTTNTLKQFCDSTELNFNISDAHVVLKDISPFIPALRHFTTPIDIKCDISGVVNHLRLDYLDLSYGDKSIVLKSKGNLDDITSPRSAFIFGKIQELNASSEGLQSIINDFSPTRKGINPALAKLGTVNFHGEISGFVTQLVTYGDFQSNLGNIRADMMIKNENEALAYKGSVETSGLRLGLLLPEGNPLGDIRFRFDLDSRHPHNGISRGKLSGEIGHIDFKGYTYENISLNGNYNGSKYDGTLNIDDPNGSLQMNGIIDLLNKRPIFQLIARGENIRLHELKLAPQYKNSSLGFILSANFEGNNLDNAEGILSIDTLSFNNNGKLFTTQNFQIEAHNEQSPQSVTIESELINGKISGQYSFNTLKDSFIRMLASVLPSLVSPPESKQKTENNFTFNFNIQDTRRLSDVFSLPFILKNPAKAYGYFSDKNHNFKMEGSLPEFQIKKMQFASAGLYAEKQKGNISLQLRAMLLNKQNKQIQWSLGTNAHDDLLDTRINWSNSGIATFCGEISTQSKFIKMDELTGTEIQINPTQLILNDTIWNISPSQIAINDGKIHINNFEVRHDSQFIHLNGTVSKLPKDELNLQLNDINLDYIFGSLNIKHVVFGGQATGTFSIAGLLSKDIRLSTKQFDVINFAYNHSMLGDLHLYSQWERETQGILLQGKISQPNTADTRIEGYIFPTRDSLHLSFDANRLNLEFLRPFMDNILSNVTGRATGKLDFYGRFKALNVTGDAFIDNFAFDIGYLNTSFSISDTVHLTPSSIYFNDVTLCDRDGKQAKARGILHHRNFRNLDYDIGISGLQNFLVYNMTEKLSPVYYGTIYGSGAATIKGDLVKTDIDVNMSTDANSKFTYVLTGNETASDYPFITFVNRRSLNFEKQKQQSDSISGTPQIAEKKKHLLNINLQIDATPNASMRLVMDPATGDVIKATGNGAIRIEYNTLSDMKIYGTYTLEKGNYNFNLQDLITRDFTIRSGSSISFRGTPLNAELNIEAYYALTANLQDLDESFADDKELARTNVPVQTILRLTGDLQRPDFKFDLNFPTLSQDVDRRVRSIVSTDEMMNRQIIYLLALSKFYTPDYMNVGQTRNNELVSVASSTLSSQLSNMLGQISDKWNIGTNIRSDKGDFSDVEFELALSSQLLNNRLIFNGNFGYRDNPVNSNTFIGDFDLEYLLSKSGNLRLKAYNHYNDKNYYIKSALTTQGVGIMYKRDFTKFSDLFYRIRETVHGWFHKKRDNQKSGQQPKSVQEK